LADAPTTPQGDRPAPFRYLFLTKYEPHRKQIGRLVERVNALGTMRLYALKNWSIIRDADAQIRIYGQELDATMKAWTEDVRTINKDFKEKQDKVTKEMIQSLQNYTRQNKYEIPPKQLGEIDAPAQ
jgi:DNA-binding ferritin-like protein